VALNRKCENNVTALPDEKTGVIGRVIEHDMPVIYSFDSNLPVPEMLQSLGWLAVVSWKYDGSTNNGMPPQELNQRMILLESSIEEHAWGSQLYRAYGRTGNGRKELVYYTSSQETFLQGINAALTGIPVFPINITFYADAGWEDLKRLQSDFAGKA